MRITANQVTVARLIGLPFVGALAYGDEQMRIIAVILGTLIGLTDTVDQFGREPDERSLVSVLKLTRLRRKVGTRRYEVVVDAREFVLVDDVVHVRVEDRLDLCP